MQCEEIQGLILSDYLDNELEEEKRKDIEQHLSKCTGCQQFLAMAQNSTLEPFLRSKRINLSQEAIWQKIKEQIETEGEKSVIYEPTYHPAPFWQRLSFIFRPAFGLSMLAVVILITTLYFRSEQTKMAGVEEEEGQYLAYVIEEFSAEELGEEDELAYEFGTAIEEYFL